MGIVVRPPEDDKKALMIDSAVSVGETLALVRTVLGHSREVVVRGNDKLSQWRQKLGMIEAGWVSDSAAACPYWRSNAHGLRS